MPATWQRRATEAVGANLADDVPLTAQTVLAQARAGTRGFPETPAEAYPSEQTFDFSVFAQVYRFRGRYSWQAGHRHDVAADCHNEAGTRG